ncbi:PH domain-containing protein [Occultella glacieicola]|uniref:PH domain-containing protein n=1 Tax=Occultella glacieicola TaxID=2518684 RepID=A0ABY2E0Y8_9MICO|nr:PH domain-containing protein [Occultella glacieicola]TDE90433.1 PH domain-containing protein [Occultella glacieicola]
MPAPRTTGMQLRPPRHRYDRRVVAWWRWSAIIWTAVIALPLVVLGIIIAPARVWLLGPAAVVIVVGGGLAVALPLWWYAKHRWEVTEHAVYTRTGYFWQTWRVAPMSRIQTVDTTRGPLQRAFGLATVVVTTASAAGPVSIAGLDDAQATELAHELTIVTNATPGDAT